MSATAGPFLTPTGEPCPRQLRADGTVEGPGDCYGCGSCLLFELQAWPVDPEAVQRAQGLCIDEWFEWRRR